MTTFCVNKHGTFVLIPAQCKQCIILIVDTDGQLIICIIVNVVGRGGSSPGGSVLVPGLSTDQGYIRPYHRPHDKFHTFAVYLSIDSGSYQSRWLIIKLVIGWGFELKILTFWNLFEGRFINSNNYIYLMKFKLPAIFFTWSLLSIDKVWDVKCSLFSIKINSSDS